MYVLMAVARVQEHKPSHICVSHASAYVTSANILDKASHMATPGHAL